MNSAVTLLYFGGGCLAVLSVCGVSLLIQRCLRNDAMPRHVIPPARETHQPEENWDVHYSMPLWTVTEEDENILSSPTECTRGVDRVGE
jgi:hypothetical protein